MRQILTRTIDARPLAAGRVLVGLASLPLILEWSAPLRRAASPDALAIPLAAGVPSVTPAVVIALMIAAALGGIGMTLGIAARASSWLVALTGAAVLLVDQQTFTNHLLLMVLLATFLAMSGASEAWTIRNRTGTAAVPYWPAFLIKAQVTTLYAWTAISKINPDYLSGEVLRNHLREWPPLSDGLVQVLAISSILLEALLAIVLWIPKVRLFGFVLGMGLHIGILVMLTNTAPLVLFVLLVLPAYILFWADERHRRATSKELESASALV